MMAELHAVGPPDPDPALAPSSVTDAVKSGDQRAILVALRERLGEAISAADCSPRDLAALSRRLQDISDQIAALDAAHKQDTAELGHRDEPWQPELI